MLLRQASWLICMAVHKTASAFSFQYLPPPNLDVASLGEVAIVGQFDGIDLYNHVNQTSIFPPDTSSLLLSYNKSTFYLASTNQGGTLSAICILPSANGHQVYVGGNFTSFSNQAANNIVRFDPSSQTIDFLSGGLDGPVHGLACDAARTAVYVGGGFSKPTNAPSTSIPSGFANAAVWNPQNASWTAFPFKGFNAAVFTVAQSVNNDSVYFGGAFTSTGNASALTASNAQPVNFASAQVTGENSASTAGLDQPRNSICSNGTDGIDHSWLLQDQTAGSLQALFPYTIQPSLLRLRNTNYQGRGTKIFRVIAIPQNGIMNLTYIDASTGQPGHCEAFCPLSNEGFNVYQDYQFVNVIGMTGFRFEILDWYGDGGGLHDIEIYQAAIYVYANDAYNVAPCGNSTQKSSVEISGQWQLGSSSEISGQYLTTTFPSNQLSTSNASVTYFPYLPQSGVYSILLYTPGCRGSRTCDQRTTVDITVNYAPGKLVTTTIYQTNNDEKYDTIYTGPVQTSTNGFQPSVAVRLSALPMPVSADTVEFVAQSVQFVINGNGIGLNGLYEWTVNDAKQNLTKFDMVGATLPVGTVVNAIVPTNNGVFIGGNFGLVNGTSANAFEFANNVTVPLAAEGLNGEVNTIAAVGDDVYFGGSFNTTFSGSVQNLNNIARYSTRDGQWHPLIAGVNGAVQSVSLTDNSDLLAIGGLFTGLATSAVMFSGTAFWNVSSMQWSSHGPLVGGQELTTSQISDGAQTFGYIAGAISSYSSLSAFGASKLAGIDAAVSYDLTDVNADVHTASFWQNRSDTLAILSGKLEINDSETVALSGSNGLHTPLGELPAGEVYASLIDGDRLYLGGNFSSSNASTMPIYDLTTNLWQHTPSLPTSNGSAIIYAMAKSPSNDGILVAGSFVSINSSPCSSVCLWNTELSRWTAYGLGLSGIAKTVQVSQSLVLIGGDLRLNNQPSYLNRLDTDTMTWTALPEPPGVPSSLAINNNNLNDTFIAGSKLDGSHYIVKFDGSGYTDISNDYFGTPSVIDQIQILPLLDYSEANSILGPNRLLLATGNFTMRNATPFSGVVYDGTSWKPYLLTTTINGTPGRVRGLFHSMPVFIHAFVAHLPVALVILISIAISLGLVFLLVLVSLLWSYRRKRINDNNHPQKLGQGSRSLFAAIGASSAFSTAAMDKHLIASAADPSKVSTAEKTSTMSTKRTVVNPDPINDSIKSKSSGIFGSLSFASRNRPLLHQGRRIATPNSPQIFDAKHTFVAKEHGELGFSSGDHITVLDNSDEFWWLGRIDDGPEGIFPASYLT